MVCRCFPDLTVPRPYFISYYTINFFAGRFNTSSGATTMCFLFIEMKMAFLHIVFDRFLEIFLNIKYTRYMTCKTMLRLVAMHWIISFTSSIINIVSVAVDIRTASFQVTSLLYLILDSMVLQ